MPRARPVLDGPGSVQGLKRRVDNSALENAHQRLIRSGNISAQALDILSKAMAHWEEHERANLHKLVPEIRDSMPDAENNKLPAK